MIQGSPNRKAPAAEQPTDPEVQAALDANAPERTIKVRETLKGATPVVRRSVKALRRIPPDGRGQVQLRGPGYVQLNVTKGSLERAARIADAFIVTCQAQGLMPESHAADADCSVQLHGESIAFGIFESVNRTERAETADERRRRERAPHVWGDDRHYEYHPTGRLVFRFDGLAQGLRMRWSDGKTQRLEDLVSEIVAGAIRLAVVRRQRHEAQEARRRAWEEAQRLRREEQHQQEEEQRRCEQLIRDAERWEAAHRIRHYIAALERAADSSGRPMTHDSPHAAWIHWADGVARALDPICATASNHPAVEAFEQVRAGATDPDSSFSPWSPRR